MIVKRGSREGQERVHRDSGMVRKRVRRASRERVSRGTRKSQERVQRESEEDPKRIRRGFRESKERV